MLMHAPYPCVGRVYCSDGQVAFCLVIIMHDVWRGVALCMNAIPQLLVWLIIITGP